MESQERKFPAQFVDLEEFQEWSLATTADRIRKRLASSKDEILQFHSAVAPRIDEIMGHLNQYPLGSMPSESQALLDLALSLAEIGPYAEWFDGVSESPITKGLGARIEILSEPR